MTPISTAKYRKGSLWLVLSAVAVCSVTLLSGCGGKSDDTITPPPPSPSATADSKPTAPPATQAAPPAADVK